MTDFIAVYRFVIRGLILMTIFAANSASARFAMSGDILCSGKSSYSFYISENVILPDYDVVVSNHELLPDIVMQLVNNPQQADIVFIDNDNKSDIKVCKTTIPIGSKSIKVSRFSLIPDIKITLSESAIAPNIRIFIKSKIFSNEEVAAVVAVLIKSKK